MDDLICWRRRAHAPAAAALGASMLRNAEAGKEVSARHIQQRMPRWKQYAARLLSTASGAPAADIRMPTTAPQPPGSALIRGEQGLHAGPNTLGPMQPMGQCSLQEQKNEMRLKAAEPLF